MGFLSSLWIPILASTAAAWILGAIFWMALPHHRKDTKKLPNEDAFKKFVRESGITPGLYAFPFFANHKECNSPEAKKAWTEGPTGFFCLWAPVNMAKNMILTILVHLVAGTLIAYVAWAALGAGEASPSFARVMQVVGTIGVLTYCFGGLTNAIWFQTPKRAMLMNFIDGVLYGLATGAIFAALWP